MLPGAPAIVLGSLSDCLAPAVAVIPTPAPRLEPPAPPRLRSRRGQPLASEVHRARIAEARAQRRWRSTAAARRPTSALATAKGEALGTARGLDLSARTSSSASAASSGLGARRSGLRSAGVWIAPWYGPVADVGASHSRGSTCRPTTASSHMRPAGSRLDAAASRSQTTRSAPAPSRHRPWLGRRPGMRLRHQLHGRRPRRSRTVRFPAGWVSFPARPTAVVGSASWAAELPCADATAWASTPCSSGPCPPTSACAGRGRCSRGSARGSSPASGSCSSRRCSRSWTPPGATGWRAGSSTRSRTRSVTTAIALALQRLGLLRGGGRRDARRRRLPRPGPGVRRANPGRRRGRGAAVPRRRLAGLPWSAPGAPRSRSRPRA